MSTSATPIVPRPGRLRGLVVADHVTPPLDHLPRPGELITVDNLMLNIGGAANTAVNLSGSGSRPRLRRVGADIFGRFATSSPGRGELHVAEGRPSQPTSRP